MSTETPIAYVDLRVIAHATEDLEGVLASVWNILPSGSHDLVHLRKMTLTGHHGNPITLLETRIRDRRLVQQISEKLSCGLSVLEKEILCGEIDQHLEKGNLYIRLDKQLAFKGEMKMGDADPIHLRFHFKEGRQRALSACQEIGLIP